MLVMTRCMAIIEIVFVVVTLRFVDCRKYEPKDVFEIYRQKQKLCRPENKKWGDAVCSWQCKDLDARCEAWKAKGYCDVGGIIMQACAKTCNTCFATATMDVVASEPGDADLCKDRPGMEYVCAIVQMNGGCPRNSPHATGEMRRNCGGTCGYCKPGLARLERLVQDPVQCFADLEFSTYTRNQQLTVSCNCYNTQLNVYTGCCGQVWAHYFPDNPTPDCSLVKEPAQWRELSGLYKAECCFDYHCGVAGVCVCSDTMVSGQVLKCNYADGVCRGQCVGHPQGQFGPMRVR